MTTNTFYRLYFILFLILVNVGLGYALVHPIANTKIISNFSSGTLQYGDTSSGISLITNETSKYISSPIQNGGLLWDKILIDYTADVDVNITYAVRTFNDVECKNIGSVIQWCLNGTNASIPVGNELELLNITFPTNFIDGSPSYTTGNKYIKGEINNCTIVNSNYINVTTVEFWYNQNVRSQKPVAIDLYNAGESGWSYRFTMNSGYQIDSQVYHSNGSSIIYPNLENINKFNDGDWHHVIVSLSYDKTNMTSVMYLDGLYVANATRLLGKFNGGNVSRLVFGSDYNYNGQYDLSLRNVKIYNRYISLNESDWDDSYKLRSSGVPVYAAHTISNVSGYQDSAYSWSDTKLDALLSWMNVSGYHTITVEQYALWTQGNYVLPKKSVIFTFDDGKDSNYLLAYPIFKKYGYVATVGIITNQINHDGYMTSTQLQDLYANGWEIASHSVNHNALTNLNDTERIYEFSQSKSAIASIIGHTPTTFIFPGNRNNVLILSECSKYYTVCFAQASDIPEQGSKTLGFNQKYFNLTKDTIRATIMNSTTLRAAQQYLIYGNVAYKEISEAKIDSGVSEWINTYNDSAKYLQYVIGIYRTNITAHNNITRVMVISKSTSKLMPELGSYSNLTYIDSVYDDVGQILNLSCLGSGPMVLTNMAILGNFSVFYNDTLFGYGDSDNYTLATCGYWVFRKDYTVTVVNSSSNSSNITDVSSDPVISVATNSDNPSNSHGGSSGRRLVLSVNTSKNISEPTVRNVTLIRISDEKNTTALNYTTFVSSLKDLVILSSQNSSMVSNNSQTVISWIVENWLLIFVILAVLTMFVIVIIILRK